MRLPAPGPERRPGRRGQTRSMTSSQLTPLSLAPAPGPVWVHLLVTAFALIVLVHTLARHR